MNTVVENQLDQLMVHSEDNVHSLHSEFEYDTILITGAAGSVGSELTRQISKLKFTKLILADIAKRGLIELEEKLHLKTKKNIFFVRVDICNNEELTCLFQKFNPTLIFHTAAFKHVPKMENEAHKAIKLNIGATIQLSTLALKYNCRKFIYISTDKAVEPISVMGMTKLISEYYLAELNKSSKTFFVSARFGNILGSSGSVLPIFLNQLNNNIPITITDKNATRYFINQKKAGELILKIAGFKKSEGDLFTFNMGSSIKVIDLANYLIKKHSNNSEIRIIGLRPGEKLHEKLTSDSELLLPTRYQDILKVERTKIIGLKNKSLQDLTAIPADLNNIEIKSILVKYTQALLGFSTFLFALN